MIYISRILTFALLALFLIVPLVYNINHATTNNKALKGERDVIQFDTPPTGTVEQTEKECLVEALYFEAAYNDSYEGLAAVIFVILNRTKDREYPHTICGVVHQGWPGPLNHCQFSYYCDGKPETYTSRRWKQALTEFVNAFLANPPADFTNGRKFYFAHQYFVQMKKEPPHWNDCEIFGSQTFCQSIPPRVRISKTQVAQKQKQVERELHPNQTAQND